MCVYMYCTVTVHALLAVHTGNLNKDTCFWQPEPRRESYSSQVFDVLCAAKQFQLISDQPPMPPLLQAWDWRQAKGPSDRSEPRQAFWVVLTPIKVMDVDPPWHSCHGSSTSSPLPTFIPPTVHHYTLNPIPSLSPKNLHHAAVHFTTLPTTHPLHGAVKNTTRWHVKWRPTPLHYLMNNYQDVKPHLIETIKPVQKSSAWAPKLAVRIADMREKAKEEDEAEWARLWVYSDDSGIGGKIGAAAVLYRDGILQRTRRLQLGSDKHHTVYETEGIGMILGLQLLWRNARKLRGWYLWVSTTKQR